jgi:hypothetical protein
VPVCQTTNSQDSGIASSTVACAICLCVAVLGLACSEPTAAPQPARLAVVTPPTVNAVNRVPFAAQPVIRLETLDGNVVARSGIPVSVAITAGGGTLVGELTVVTDTDGRAAFTGLAIQGVAGAKTLTFSAPSLSAATASLTTVGGTATTLELEAGDAQVEGEGIAVPVRPAVRASDVDGNGSPGTTVTFAVTSGGGSITGAAQVTNATGIATVGGWTLGDEGDHALRASAPGVADTVTFTATALRLAVASVGVTSLESGPLTAHTTRQLSAAARDSVGRALTNRDIVWSSADTGIVSVTEEGMARGELPGTGAVLASSEGVTGSLPLTVVAPTLAIAVPSAENDSSLTGHLGAQVNGNAGPPPGFAYGFGYYSSVHALSDVHARRAQLGWGAWMLPDNRDFDAPLCPVGTVARDNWPERGPSYRDVYQTIEGGMGKWGSTRFPAPIAKFRVNGTPDCYNTQIASSTWTFGGELLPNDKLGLAQLSNRLLVPPDGLTFTTSGTMFGNAWIALPLIPAYTAPTGLAVGDQSWTLFVRASNFSGPVTFYTPETWTRVHLTDATGRGRSHDVRPMFGGGVAMEMGTLPFFTGIGPDGTRFRRVPRLTFPIASAGQSVLQQDLSFFSKQAIWDGIATWMTGGAPVTAFNEAGASSPTVAGSSMGVRLGGQNIEFPTSFYAGAVTTAASQQAFGLRWTGGEFEEGVFPEYYRETDATWTAVPASEVPRTTWLIDQTFPALARGSYARANTSVSAPFDAGAWAAGPFITSLSDGSSVEYVWYRFVDQPAIARLGLTAETLDSLQAFVESLHANSGTMGVSLPAPTSGTLAMLDPAQIVSPPAGLEVGYVPVVIRQF